MTWVYRFLIFTFPLTLFSVNISGLEFYPAFLLAPLGILELNNNLRNGHYNYVSKSTIGVILFAILILLHAASQHFIAKDFLKLFTFILLYQSLRFLSRKNDIKITDMLDAAIVAMIIYGLFQILAVTLGSWNLANALHSAITAGEHAAIDRRGIGPLRTYRVASLTLEPSYFSFICLVYVFITERKSIKWLCILGIFMAHSMITINALFGLGVYKLYKKIGIPTVFFFITILLAHLVFATTVYHEIPNALSQTFFDRYAGLVEFTSTFNWFEMINGSMSVDMTYPVNLIRPFSNLGSVLFLFGLVGFSLYVFIFRALEKEAIVPKAIIMIFMCMFNYYYLTSWPYIVAFFFLALEGNRPRPELRRVSS